MEAEVMDRQDEKQEEYFRFLDNLRKGGRINMFEAPFFLQDTYGLTRAEAKKIFATWAETFSQRHPKDKL